MAKQTFTTGQVLTAAQMTSLQQTAMLGGSTTAKTANYVLVAADAGTVVAMNAAGSTTITVNSGLFSAGDIVTIMNYGAGTTTITAGTATINTAGSLAVPQYDGGVLYFTSASAAIYYDFTQVGIQSPLTTKGDLWSYSTTDTRLASSAVNGQVLTVDTTTATGLKWAAPGGGSSYTLLNSPSGTALTAATTITVSGISNVDKVFIRIDNASSANAASAIRIRFNSDSTSNYLSAGAYYSARSTLALSLGVQGVDSSVTVAEMAVNAASSVYGSLLLTGCNSSGLKHYVATGGAGTAASATDQAGFWLQGIYNSSSTISSISIISSTGNFDSGTVFVYTSS